MGLDNPLHIAFLLIVLLLVFGARRLPEMGRSLGSGMREFKDSISGETRPTITHTAQQQPAPPQPVAAQAPVAAPPVAAPPTPVAEAQAPPTQAPAEPAQQA
jgi:sec-independent protein translocase protein TatA